MNNKNIWKSVLFLLLNLLAMEAGAQGKVTLSGLVTDREGEPLPQVTLAVENSSRGTYTDDHGRYSLQLPVGKTVIVISYLGYQTLRQQLELKQDTHMNFRLQESPQQLKQVYVYGKSQTQQLKESALTVNALDIKPIVNSLNNLNELVNRTSGVKVREEGGVGSDFDLSINGLSGNSVRYFIDGVPLDTKGSEVSLANLPVNIIDRIEIYKGVVPASLGTDALGGAINIITNEEKRNYLDASYGIGSFHTHKADLTAQYVEPHTGLIVRPTLGVNYSKNDYRMKGVEVWDEDTRKYVPVNRKRFHDDYFSMLGQLEVGFVQKPWADQLFVSASWSKVDKELQTGSIQDRVYGMAERKAHAWNVSARYRKRNFLVRGLQMSASLSHTWDYSQTVDTAYRQYDWNGEYIVSSRNEITGRGRALRHYYRPLTVVRSNWDYRLTEGHSLNLNYMLSRTGNKRYDEVDETFGPSSDVLCKHILNFSYNQTLWNGRMDNTFFVKDYINHTRIEQTDLSSITGSDEVRGSTTHSYWGYGAGMRFTVASPLALKFSYEHSIRLPLVRELLGNGTTIYPNVALKPESSHNLNLGLFGTWRPRSGHTLYYEAGGFLRFVDDYIQTVVSEKEGTMQYGNVPAVHVKGVEGEVRYDWQNRLQLAATFSWQDARDQKKYKTDGKPSATYHNKVPNRPWMFGGMEANYTFYGVGLPDSRLRLGFNYHWVHWYYLSWEAYGAAESKARIPEQNVCNANLTYSWHDGTYNFSLECSNLFDRLVYDNYRLQKPGRALFAKFRLFIH